MPDCPDRAQWQRDLPAVPGLLRARMGGIVPAGFLGQRTGQYAHSEEDQRATKFGHRMWASITNSTSR